MKASDLKAMLEVSGTTPQDRAMTYLSTLDKDDPLWLELSMIAYFGNKRWFRTKNAVFAFLAGFIPSAVAFVLSALGG
jgi:hypothetical protein